MSSLASSGQEASCGHVDSFVQGVAGGSFRLAVLKCKLKLMC
jgi:hypothetical protein